MVRSPEELRRTAYHEAGHAIVGRCLPETDPVHKVTIIPRGRALGVTFFLPEEDKYGKSRTAMESEIGMAFGGRAAELLIFNEYTTGAAQDIKQATAMARSMVCLYGMSDAIGPMAVGGQSQEVFVGREWVANKEHSEETARLVDSEVKRIIDEAMKKATGILNEHIDALHRLADALLERETLTGAEVDIIMRGEELPPQQIAGKPNYGDARGQGRRADQDGHGGNAGYGPRNGGYGSGQDRVDEQPAERRDNDGQGSGYGPSGRPDFRREQSPWPAQSQGGPVKTEASSRGEQPYDLNQSQVVKPENSGGPEKADSPASPLGAAVGGKKYDRKSPGDESGDASSMAEKKTSDSENSKDN